MGYPNATTLEIEACDTGVLRVRLNRPAVHNAFNETLIGELRSTFEAASGDPGVRLVVLTGNGKSFSAGADIAWMRQQGKADLADNVASAERMARMFHAIWACAKPVLAGVHGAALGGGTGLTAVADVAIAEESATFGFTEVRLGIIPAAISPFVIEKLGPARARALFLLGSRFDGREAERLGLVHRACEQGRLAAHVERTAAEILRGGPQALTAAKQLTHELAGRHIDEVLALTAERIASIRGTEEASEGLSAFLDKRSPSWRHRE